MKLPNQCCYKCTRRHQGCHATCETYIEAKAELEKIKAEQHKDSEINAYTADVTKKKIKQWRWKK